MPTTEWPRSSSVSREMRSDEAGGAGDDDAHDAGLSAAQATRWKPRSSVSHMILKSSDSDQFSM